MTVVQFDPSTLGFRRKRAPRTPTKRVTPRQAKNMMEGLAFAGEIGTPLNAHLTIHWGGTEAGDDPEGKLFAWFRHLFDKRLKRLNLPGGLSAIWVRERHRNKHSSQLSEVEHAHLLFHLPDQFARNPGKQEIERIVAELINHVGKGILDDRTVRLTFPANPDGKYFLKGGTMTVWQRYRIPEKWQSRRGEGKIVGKRCGTTQNLGPAARAQYTHNASLSAA